MAAKGTLLKLWLGICSKYQLHTSPGKIFIGSTILWPIILHFLLLSLTTLSSAVQQGVSLVRFSWREGKCPGLLHMGWCDGMWFTVGKSPKAVINSRPTRDLDLPLILSPYHSPVQHPLNAALVSPELTIPTAQTKPGSVTDAVNKINTVWFCWHWEFFLLPGKFLLVRLV